MPQTGGKPQTSGECISGLSPDCRITLGYHNTTGYCKACYDLAIEEGRLPGKPPGRGRPKKPPPPDPASVEYLLTELREMKALLLESIRDEDIQPAERRLFIEQARKITVSIQEITLSDLKQRQAVQAKLDQEVATTNYYLQEIQDELLRATSTPEGIAALRHSLSGKGGPTVTELDRSALFLDVPEVEVEEGYDDEEVGPDPFALWDQED